MAKKNENGLTDKHQVFADAYLVDPERNAARAYKVAHPRASAATAETNGPRLLKNPNVAAYLARHTRAATEQTGVTVERIMREIACVALSDPAAVLDEDGRPLKMRDMPDDVRRAIASYEVREYFDDSDGEKPKRVRVTKVRFWDKNRGLELAGKHLKMFTDRMETEGGGLVVNYVCNLRRGTG